MSKKIWTSIIIVVLVIAAIGFVFWRHHEHEIAISNQTLLQRRVKKVGIPSSSAPKTSNINTPEPAKTPNGNGDLQQGESVDTNGQAIATTPKSEWVTSDSGNITLEQPIANSTLSSGAKVIGTAKSPTVDYRLSDNSIGILTQGTLSVKNGKFSGVLYFTPKATSGQLDIFTTDDRGIELNEIQIGVKF